MQIFVRALAVAAGILTCAQAAPAQAYQPVQSPPPVYGPHKGSASISLSGDVISYSGAASNATESNIVPGVGYYVNNRTSIDVDADFDNYLKDGRRGSMTSSYLSYNLIYHIAGQSAGQFIPFLGLGAFTASGGGSPEATTLGGTIGFDEYLRPNLAFTVQAEYAQPAFHGTTTTTVDTAFGIKLLFDTKK
ncbi:MAG: hypothetical protein ACLQVD_17315 [Capsulimonadaceae bacterium]